jgi:hypothetical protein
MTAAVTDQRKRQLTRFILNASPSRSRRYSLLLPIATASKRGYIRELNRTIAPLERYPGFGLVRPDIELADRPPH